MYGWSKHDSLLDPCSGAALLSSSAQHQNSRLGRASCTVCFIPWVQDPHPEMVVRREAVEVDTEVTNCRAPSLSTGRRYVAPAPARSKVRAVCEKISEPTSSRTTWRDPSQVVVRINRVLTEWANYNRMGYVTGAWKVVQGHTCRRLRRWMCRKHRGVRRYQNLPDLSLYETYGLVKLTERIRRKQLWAKARSI